MSDPSTAAGQRSLPGSPMFPPGSTDPAKSQHGTGIPRARGAVWSHHLIFREHLPKAARTQG